MKFCVSIKLLELFFQARIIRSVSFYIFFSWSTHWFKITAQIPEDWIDEQVRFRWNSNSEAMVRISNFCNV